MSPEPGQADPACTGPVPPAAVVTDPVEQLYAELESRVRTARPQDDVSTLQKTYRYARKCHENQLRQDGRPYMTHPLEVTLLLTNMQMDMVCLQTGLLHDVVEDTCASADEIRRMFGDEVARCVDGVTKLSKVNFYSREERQAESVRKMLLAMVTDIRVIIVKLADRLHNMQTLGALSRDKQERIALETLEIYSPIAHRLGMGKIRGELEDLAFRYVEPEAWAELVREIDSQRGANEEFLAGIKATVEHKLAREGIPARVDARVKRAYSIFQKMRRQKIGLDQVYDVLALRIITDTVKNCYAALGEIHNEWHPIPGRIKDFIAIPRPNLYRSLHTSVIGPGGQAFEVQIRTEDMHREAEEGIAAHWKYKEHPKGSQEQQAQLNDNNGYAADDQRIAWLRQLVEWQRELRDSTDFMSTLKFDLEPEEVYTFTPRGKVIVLPREATPIDFAYSIHSDVGNTCVGAKVNGRIVPLKYTLRNGDVVEILTQPGHQPSKDWLALVKTPRARNKIKHEINTTERMKAVEIGQKYLEKESRRLGVSLGKVTKAAMEAVAGEYGYSKIEDLHAALGYGKYSPRQVLQKVAPDKVLAEEPKKQAPAPAPEAARPAPGAPDENADLVIKVSGLDDLLVYRAKCCNPIKGEAIVGYITRGKGVAVHSRNCTNVQNLMYEVDRKVQVEWSPRSASELFPVRLVIRTDDRPGMLNQVTMVLFAEQVNIRSVEANSNDRRVEGAVVEMTAEIRDKKQLERIVSAIRRISGVRDVERVR